MKLAMTPREMIVVVLFVHNVCGSHFMGATMSWAPANNNTITISFRITWKQRSYACDEQTIMKRNLLGTGSMSCVSGCSGSVGSLLFFCTDFKAGDWSSGENSINYTTTAKQFKLGYSSAGWSDLVFGSGGGWSLQATVDLSIRSSGKINSSPTVNMPPVLYWKAGCLHVFTIPVSDVDGDVMKCRRAKGTDECGQVCNSFPGLVLNETSCTISYSTISTIGYYAVSLQIEDFVSKTSTVPLSSIPLQFLVKTYSGAGCSDEALLVYPTPETGKRYILDTGQILHFGIKAKGTNSFHRIVTQSGVRLIRSREVKSLNSSWNYIEMNVTWTAHSNESGKAHNLCFYARDIIGVTSDTRCVTIQISDIDNCAFFPCKNGGTCSDDINTYTCICTPGYIGKNCSVDVNECKSNPCQNGAKCTDKANGYLCTCVSGFIGTYCDIEANGCQSNPCQNYASCTDELNGYLCTCVLGFTGQIRLLNYYDECISSPCENGGTCADRINGYECSCAAGYTGANCKTEIDECISSPCRNKANCSDGMNAYRCFCLEGYSGYNCETDLDECISNPCQFGGNCSDRINGYVCSCVTGYAGINCETDIDDKLGNMQFLTTIIVGAVLGAAVVILAVFATYKIFATKTKKSSKAHSGQENSEKTKTKTKRENTFVNKSYENEIKLSEEEIYEYKVNTFVKRSSGDEAKMSEEAAYVNMPSGLRNNDKSEESELRHYDIPEEEYANCGACDRVESRIYETIY